MSPRLLRCLAVVTALAIPHGGPLLLFVPTARADHDGTCHPGGGNVHAIWLTTGFFETSADARLALALGGGRAKPRAGFHDGTSNTLLVGEIPPTPTCADADGDGVAGIVEIAVVVHASRPTGRESLTIVVVPAAGEIDRAGAHSATALVDDGSNVVELDGLVLAASAKRR